MVAGQSGVLLGDCCLASSHHHHAAKLAGAHLPKLSPSLRLELLVVGAGAALDDGSEVGAAEAEGGLASSSSTSNRSRLPRSAMEPWWDELPREDTRGLLCLRVVWSIVSSSRSKMPAVLERREVRRRSDDEACELAESEAWRLPCSWGASPGGAELKEDMAQQHASGSRGMRAGAMRRELRSSRRGVYACCSIRGVDL